MRCPCGVPRRSDTLTQGDRMIVVGSPHTLNGYRTESLGLLTGASVTFGIRLT